MQAAESDGRDGIEQLTPTPEHYYEDPLPPGAVARLGTERFRLTGWHKSLEFTSDGRKLLAASADETIIPMWNPRTGELLGEILTDPYPVRFMQVLSDGKTLITYGYHYPPGTRQLSPGERAPHRVIQIWDLEKGVLRSIVEPNLERNEEVRSLVVTPDDNSVALGTGMGDIRVLAIPSGKERFRRNFGLQGVETLAISSDGQLLAAGVGNDVHLWRWFDGNEPEKVFESKNHVTCVAFSPDAERLVIAGVAETKLVVWNVARKQIHVNLEVEARRQMYIREMAFANGGQLLLATNANTGPSSEPGVLMWNTVTGKYIRRFDLGGHTTSALAVSPDGQLLAAIGDSTCVVWELRTGKKLSGGLVGHQDSIGAVSRFSHDGTIVTADDVGTVRLWDTGSGRQIRIWDHGSRVGAVDISPDGEWIASSGDDIRIWNAKTGDEEFRVAGQRLSPRKAIAFTRDYQRLVSWGGDGFVQIWDTAAGKLLAEHSVDLISLGEQVDERYQHRETFSLASDARHFCLANGAKLHIFNTETGERIEKQELGLIDGYRSHELQLSPNGAKVFVITADNPAIPDLLTAQLIDLASGEVQWEHKLPLGPCGPSGFSPDGTLVAASVRSNRGALVVWDVATGTERARFESVPKTAWGGLGRKLAISSDNTRLAVAMMDTTTLIWDISQGK